jgi:hypothetical protein
VPQLGQPGGDLAQRRGVAEAGPLLDGDPDGGTESMQDLTTQTVLHQIGNKDAVFAAMMNMLVIDVAELQECVPPNVLDDIVDTPVENG